MLEIGPGTGSLAARAIAAGWRYRAIEASETLADTLRAKASTSRGPWAPPTTTAATWSTRTRCSSTCRGLTPHVSSLPSLSARSDRGGVCFIVVPDYLKERTFFWDVDYTHNFVTTERRGAPTALRRRVEMQRVVRSIGVATGLGRDLLAAGALLVNVPGVDALSRYTRTEDLLFRIRKNLFETLTFIARKPAS